MIGRYYISAVCLIVSFGIANAQLPGFIGKKTSISAGVCLNPRIFNLESFGTNDSVYNSFLPPKINLGIARTIGRKTDIVLFGSFYPMRNSQFYMKNSNVGTNYERTFADTFKLRTNMYSINGGMRFYKEFSQYGKFNSIGVSGNYYNTRIYPTSYTKIVDNNVITTNEVENLPTATEWTYNLGVYFGKGRQQVYANNLKIDYGVRFWLFFGKNPYPRDKDYRTHLGEYVDNLVQRRAWESQFFEVFFNIGLLK